MEENPPQKISIDPKSVLMVIGLGVLTYGLWYLRGIVLVILASVVIATFVYGGVNWLSRFKIPRPVSVVIIYVFGIALFGGALYLFVPIFLDELIGLVGLLPENSGLSAIFGSLGDGGLKEVVNQFSGAEPLQVVEQIRAQFATTGVIQGFSNVFGGIVNFLLVLVVSFYLSMREHGVEQFLRIVTPIQHELYVIDVWQRSRIKIASWFRGQLFLAMLHAVLTYVGLVILGVPYAFMLSLLTLLLSLVPFGIILAAFPAAAFAFLSGGMSLLLLTVGLYFILEQLETYVFQPYIVKRLTGIPSLIVLLGLVIGAKLAGILGVLLAVPVAVVILELVTDAEKRRIDALTD